MDYQESNISNVLYPEIFYVFIPFCMLNKMFVNYILPITRCLFNRICQGKSVKKLTFETNRKYVAHHIKSVFEKVKVYVISDLQVCNDIVEQRMMGKNGVHFIGLDCEWDASKKNGVALLQISSGNDCILYRTFKTNGMIPEKLKLILEDRKVLKFGVAIQEDARRLRIHGVDVKGFVDLRNVAQRCLPQEVSNDEEELYQWTSLKSLSNNALDMKLSKNFHVRCGNWETPNLSRQQVLYAAKDAIVSLEIFYALILLRKLHRFDNSVLNESFITEMEHITEWSATKCVSNPLQVYSYCHVADQISDLESRLPLSHLLSKPSFWLKELAYSFCQGIVDVSHKYRPPVNVNKAKASIQSRGLCTKASSLQKDYRHQCRDKPLYENCFLVAPDKRILATVNRSKAQWYLQRRLGVVDCEDPFTVRLLFEPSGRPMPDADYYTTVKENICVVCGNTGNFVRKMIIPHDYRKYFPQNFKDHMSHDVLLMCLDCHRIAQQGDEIIRQELAYKYNAPLGTTERMMFIDNPDLAKVKSAAKALRHGREKIPAPRREQLEKTVAMYYKVNDISDELLEKASNLDARELNRKFEGLHGERVVKAIFEANELEKFVKMWRQHFLDYMQPKHLPEMWSVEHNLHKLKPSFKLNQLMIDINIDKDKDAGLNTTDEGLKIMKPERDEEER